MEALVVIAVSATLLTIALNSLASARAGYALSGSRSALVALHGRARIGAVEQGTATLLHIDLEADTAAVTRGGDVLARIDFGQEYGVDIQGNDAALTLCMSPRGYADPACTSFSTARRLRFSGGGETLALEVLPLGQMVY
jgi:Tfp pilus assembly protein FimT